MQVTHTRVTWSEDCRKVWRRKGKGTHEGEEGRTATVCVGRDWGGKVYTTPPGLERGEGVFVLWHGAARLLSWLLSTTVFPVMQTTSTIGQVTTQTVMQDGSCDNWRKHESTKRNTSWLLQFTSVTGGTSQLLRRFYPNTPYYLLFSPLWAIQLFPHWIPDNSLSN